DRHRAGHRYDARLHRQPSGPQPGAAHPDAEPDRLRRPAKGYGQPRDPTAGPDSRCRRGAAGAGPQQRAAAADLWRCPAVFAGLDPPVAPHGGPRRYTAPKSGGCITGRLQRARRRRRLLGASPLASTDREPPMHRPSPLLIILPLIAGCALFKTDKGGWSKPGISDEQTASDLGTCRDGANAQVAAEERIQRDVGNTAPLASPGPP